MDVSKTLSVLRRSGLVSQAGTNRGQSGGELIADSYLDQIGGGDCTFDSFSSGGAFSSTFASSGGDTC